jgi:hypothetical protein
MGHPLTLEHNPHHRLQRARGRPWGLVGPGHPLALEHRPHRRIRRARSHRLALVHHPHRQLRRARGRPWGLVSTGLPWALEYRPHRRLRRARGYPLGFEHRPHPAGLAKHHPRRGQPWDPLGLREHCHRPWGRHGRLDRVHRLPPVGLGHRLLPAGLGRRLPPVGRQDLGGLGQSLNHIPTTPGETSHLHR